MDPREQGKPHEPQGPHEKDRPPEKRRRRRRRGPLLLLFLLLLLLLLALMLLGDQDFGFGSGFGLQQIGIGTGRGEAVGPPVTSATETPGGNDAPGAREIEIRVEEDRIYVDGEVVESADAVAEYIEAINTDETTYRLTDAHAVQQTYTDVKAVLDRLALNYVEGRED